MIFYITPPISGSTVMLDVPSVDHAQFAILELKRETGKNEFNGTGGFSGAVKRSTTLPPGNRFQVIFGSPAYSWFLRILVTPVTTFVGTILKVITIDRLKRIFPLSSFLQESNLSLVVLMVTVPLKTISES